MLRERKCWLTQELRRKSKERGNVPSDLEEGPSFGNAKVEKKIRLWEGNKRKLGKNMARE